MTDLEINIALAEAMGWVEVSEHEWLFSNKVVGFLMRADDVICVTCSDVLDDNGEILYLEKTFDYRDPVIFVAICKHWALGCCFCGGCGVVGCLVVGKFFKDNSIEKAAALCVIDAVKRGVK